MLAVFFASDDPRTSWSFILLRLQILCSYHTDGGDDIVDDPYYVRITSQWVYFVHLFSQNFFLKHILKKN